MLIKAIYDYPDIVFFLPCFCSGMLIQPERIPSLADA